MSLKRVVLSLAAVCAAAIPLMFGTPAHAQATRTWVSGVGDDANPCSRTAPCKTWAGAISKTSTGGEIDALDPGGFGALTITKSITLDGGGGQVASTLVAGTNGFVVNAPSGTVVIIRNIRVNGLLNAPTTAGLSGVTFLGGSLLILDNDDIFGFNTAGLTVALTASGGSVVVHNTRFENNNGNDINISTTTGFVSAQISDSVFTNTAAGTTNGVTAGAGSFVSVTESRFHGLAIGAQAINGGNLTVVKSLFNSCTTSGVNVGAGSTVNASANHLFNNTAGFAVTGTFNSATDNKVGGTGAITTQ